MPACKGNCGIGTVIRRRRAQSWIERPHLGIIRNSFAHVEVEQIFVEHDPLIGGEAPRKCSVY